jgi:hypothetical protein
MERSIEAVGDFTPFRAWAVLRFAQLKGVTVPDRPVGIEGARGSDRERLQEWFDQMTRAIAIRAFLGSPSGWLYGLVISIRALPAIRAAARDQIENDLDMDSGEWLATHSREAIELEPAETIDTRDEDAPRSSVHWRVLKSQLRDSLDTSDMEDVITVLANGRHEMPTAA